MAKQNLKFDASQLKNFCEIYVEQNIDDGYGGSAGVETVLLFSPRCMKKIKSKTAQSQTQGGVFDFYQVYEFTIRDDPRYNIVENMTLVNKAESYTIRGTYSLENNPNYIVIITSKK